MNEEEEEYGDDEFYELVGKSGHLEPRAYRIDGGRD